IDATEGRLGQSTGLPTFAKNAAPRARRGQFTKERLVFRRAQIARTHTDSGTGAGRVVAYTTAVRGRNHAPADRFFWQVGPDEGKSAPASLAKPPTGCCSPGSGGSYS